MNTLITCFNPCSYGSFVLTADMLVNPVKEVAKFQSLFLWIFRSYVVSAIFNALAITAVSILVLMDLSFLLLKVNILKKD